MRPNHFAEIPKGKREPEKEEERGEAYLDAEDEEERYENLDDRGAQHEKVRLKAERIREAVRVPRERETRYLEREIVVKNLCIQ